MRQFTLLDVMILTAVTALGLAFAREFSLMMKGEFATSDSLLVGALWMGLFWTLAVLPLALVAPRSRLRRCLRQPGVVAALATVLAELFMGVTYFRVLLTATVPSNMTDAAAYKLMIDLASPFRIAPAIASAWMALVVSRRWLPSSGWVDRLGRILGVFWIGTALALGLIAYPL